MRVQQQLDSVDLSAGEALDGAGQLLIDGTERLTCGQDIAEITDVLDRIRRTDLAGQPAAGSLVAIGVRKRRRDPLGDPALKHVDQSRAGGCISGQQGSSDVVGIARRRIG